MEAQKITYHYADIGHWLARCDHQNRVIELNAREYRSLSPMMKDYIWIHEYVHLLTGTRSEAECNRITDDIFVSRARNDRDRLLRQEFVQAANGQIITRTSRPISDISLFFLLAIMIIIIHNKL